MISLKDKYAIVGVGYTPQGRVPDRTALSFHLEASANAITDAGLKREDIDGLACYRHFPSASDEVDLTPYLLAQHLGLSPTYMSQDANCSRSHLQHAVGVLDAGLCNYVLVTYGHNALSSDSMVRLLMEFGADDTVFGHFGATASYALAAQRAMHTFHTGPETWKHIAVGQRKWANLNPRAMMHDRTMTFEDYYNSRWLVEPFRLFDNCLINDGGRAYVVTSLERARDLKHPPVLIMGMGQHNPAYEIQQSTYMAGPTGAKIAGEMAFKMAGITLDEIDACEIYDCFTYTVEITLQDYGFFGPGEGEDWFKGGTTGPGGRMPVNTSGGQLSEAYFMGLTPLTEAVMQIMGRCGDRQLGSKTNTKEPEIILCSDNGGVLQCHSCFILRRS
ncbi:MAG: thiolase family protein [Thermodesulfobacteriota bacterium]|nr:thiolase family protein [Thermodesulfobacteriota bacterium]